MYNSLTIKIIIRHPVASGGIDRINDLAPIAHFMNHTMNEQTTAYTTASGIFQFSSPISASHSSYQHPPCHDDFLNSLRIGQHYASSVRIAQGLAPQPHRWRCWTLSLLVQHKGYRPTRRDRRSDKWNKKWPVKKDEQCKSQNLTNLMNIMPSWSSAFCNAKLPTVLRIFAFLLDKVRAGILVEWVIRTESAGPGSHRHIICLISMLDAGY